METYTTALIGKEVVIPVIKVRYCLYARKSTEQDEKQALSIESQVKEMLQIAERVGLRLLIYGERHILQKIQVNDQFLKKFLKTLDEVDLAEYSHGHPIV